MTLGEPGVAGNDENHFRSPSGVVTAPERRHLRRRRPRLEQPHRQIFEGREVHQGLGQDRIRAGRIPDAALHFDGQTRPPVRVRPHEHADPDFRSGREVSRDLAPVRHAERHRLLRQRRRPDLRVRLRVRQCREPRLRAGNPDRRRAQRLGEIFHPRSRRKSGHDDRQRRRIRHRRQVRQRVRRRAAAADSCANTSR